MPSRTPAVFIPHGGGPHPILGTSTHAEMIEWVKKFSKTYLNELPKEILVISAHWEANVPTILATPEPPLYFDYYNFPPETYKYTYPTKNSLPLVERISNLLKNNGIHHELETTRGYDHGMFIPLLLAFPEANIPVTQISLVSSMDPVAHYELGRALSPLRDEGVLILGSGMSFHNMQGFRGACVGDENWNKSSEAFHDYLNQALLHDEQATKVKKMLNWADAPDARICHPREEHLMPLLVLLGSAGPEAKVTEIFKGKVINIKCSAYFFE